MPRKEQTPLVRHVLVDLDDTLYPERQYLLSGIRAVAQFAAGRLQRTPAELAATLENLLREPGGRAQLFDRLLRRFEAWSPESVAMLVHVYRTHAPELVPCADVERGLRLLKESGRSIGLVSDGPATVQRLKFAALQLAQWFDAVIFTDDLPPGCRKPSPIPFLVAAQLLRAPPQLCAYIADDPAKDFVAPRHLGMLTICVNRELPHPLRTETSFPESHQPDFTVADLESAVRILLSERPAGRESSPASTARTTP